MLKHVETKKKFLATHPNIITAIISITLLVLGFFIFIKPALEKSKAVFSKDVLQLELELDQKQKKLFSIKNIAKSYDDLPKDISQKLKEGLPTEPAKINLLENLSSLVASSNLKLTNIKFGNIKKPVDTLENNNQLAINEFSVNLTLGGVSYTILKNFIRNLEVNLRLVKVDRFDFDPNVPVSQVDLTAFYLEE